MAEHFAAAAKEADSIVPEIILERLLNAGPEAAPLLNSTARRWLEEKTYFPEEALALARRNLELRPQNGGVYIETVGYALFKLKVLDESERYFKEAFSAGLQNAQFGLAMVLATRGDEGDIAAACQIMEIVDYELKRDSAYTHAALNALRAALPQQDPQLRQRIERLLSPE